MKKLMEWMNAAWRWICTPFFLMKIWWEACREEEQNRRAYEADGWKFEE